MKTKNKPIEFPKDELAHDWVAEWWYFNGHLKDKKNKEYSFMNCLFKVDVKKVKIPFLSKIPLKTSYFSHSILSDMRSKKFQNRIAPFSLVSNDSFSKDQFYVNYINPSIGESYTNCVIEKVGKSAYHIKNEDIDLELVPIKKPLLEGGEGFFNFNGKRTYYYSLTNLKTTGRIRIDNKWIDVEGKSWMDHQWADASYSKDKWDWFSIQLSNNTELVCFIYDDGKTKRCLGDICYASGKQEHFEDVEIISLKRSWTSPKSKATYPLDWKIKIAKKGVEINLAAIIGSQEMLFGSINYWEGPMLATGKFENKKVTGRGFMELVGYPSQYSSVKYAGDEIKKTAGWLISMARKKASALAGRAKK